MNSKSNDTENRLVYTVKEARALLGVGRDQVYRAVKSGAIPHVRLGSRIVIPKTALHRLLDEGVTMPVPATTTVEPKRRIPRATDTPPG